MPDPTAPLVGEVATTLGPARTHTERAGGPARGLLVLGHGAGGGVDAPDLLAARDAALVAGFDVVRVEQPWRVRGRRVAEAPARLDAAWTEVLAVLDPAPRPVMGGLLVVGGRSAGARVACRTAGATRADAVLCLAFPLVPPGRPDRSRVAELALPGLPLLVVQGGRDAFGVPEGAAVVAGADHAFATRRADPPAGPQVRALVLGWLGALPVEGRGKNRPSGAR